MPLPDRHRPTALLQTCGQGYAPVHGKCSIKEPSVHPYVLKTAHSGNFNPSALYARLYHLCDLATRPLPADTKPVKESTAPPASAGLWVSSLFLRRILTAHVGEIFLVFENGSQLDIGGYKLFELLSLHSQVHRSVREKSKSKYDFVLPRSRLHNYFDL